jgi:GNAT superfamily N-acetyltransferase
VNPGYHVDCLLYRDDDGELVGILNYYPAAYPPFERASNANLWVRPDRRRQGIGRALGLEALRRWEFPGPREERRITGSGAILARSLLRTLAGTELDPVIRERELLARDQQQSSDGPISGDLP